MTSMTEKYSSSLKQLFVLQHDKTNQTTNFRPYDIWLVLLSIALLSIGLVVVTSASMPAAERIFQNPFHIAIKHGIYILLALCTAMCVVQIPMNWWRLSNAWLLLLAIVLLVSVLIVGRTVNGSTRWLGIGPITVQVAEPAKLFFFCYLAGYLVRRHEEVTENIKGFIKPLGVFFVLAFLLLMQPDLGTVVVMFCTTIGLLFLAGAKLWQFFSLVITGSLAVVVLIVFEEYRVKRVTSFLDPWADPFGSGYQLTQSLMAYGRGEIFGQGLGNSLQKLEYLPEAYNDFIMAILAEELGFVGVLVVLLIMLTIVIKALRIGNVALTKERPFDAYLAYAIGIWFSLQTAVNVGASAGILPTKGLTFPLLSYGGSSVIIMAAAMALLIRIDFELRVDGVQALNKGAANKAKKRRSTKAPKKDVVDEIENVIVDADILSDSNRNIGANHE
ncbi:cell division protein FtsW [Paraglaciecola aquimarina]|uniref:Probable peptidoglycan glycosyltransferase FtsW n=1 Tax=Paraglaciecola aquimarina TaxID=1235557 RepID=A0ABU3T2G1_9ALTE|nr:cell division protein FtsW [Paraglaciecola aquimarina]MDU0356454.1 cell division protein FtsW [Paraglaciecola aquimarina]